MNVKLFGSNPKFFLNPGIIIFIVIHFVIHIPLNGGSRIEFAAFSLPFYLGIYLCASLVYSKKGIEKNENVVVMIFKDFLWMTLLSTMASIPIYFLLTFITNGQAFWMLMSIVGIFIYPVNIIVIAVLKSLTERPKTET